MTRGRSRPPPPNFVGEVTFQYQVSDGVDLSNFGTITLTMTNTAPTAGDMSFSANHGTPITISPLVNYATDMEMDPLSLASVSNPVDQFGNVVGTLTLNSDDSRTFTPPPNFVGEVTFQYQVSDGVVPSNFGTISLTLTNTAPTAGDMSFSANHGTPITISPLVDYATDMEMDTLTLVSVSSPVDEDGNVVGTLTLNSDGSRTFTPPPNFVGEVTFQYQVSDGVVPSNFGTITLTLTNTAPTAGDMSFSANHGTPITISPLLSYATDMEMDTLSLVSVSSPVDQYGNSVGTLTLNSDDSRTFTPPPNFVGEVTFQYQVSDGVDLSNFGTITLTMTNTTPNITAGETYFYVPEDTPTGTTLPTVAGSDLDGDTFTFTFASNPGGKFAVNATTGVVSVAAALDFESLTTEAEDGFRAIAFSSRLFRRGFGGGSGRSSRTCFVCI